MTSRSPLSFFVDTARETLRARGPDAISWLNGLVSADVRGVAPGSGAYALLLTKTGKIQTDMDVLAAPGELVIGVARGTGDAVQRVLDAHLVMEDVELERAPQLSWLKLFGPGAAASSEELSGQAAAHGSIDWLGAGGAAVAFEPGALEGALSRLSELGAVALDADGWKRLRLRHGFPEFGADYGSDDNPHEAALDRRAVSWDKGCYLGQEVVCMQDLRGKVKRRLAVLEIAGSELPVLDAPVVASGSDEPVGAIRSAVVESAASVLAFARLKAPHFDAGAPTAFSVQGHAARIVALPTP
jgi:folate-binding protein YgfZ